MEIIPKNFSVLASSETVPFEIIISNDLRILAFQGHPEYTGEWLKMKNCEFVSGD